MRYRDYLFDEYKKHRNKVTYMISDSKKKFCEKILTNSKNSKDTRRAINLLTNKNANANAINGSDISPNILNNHFCYVHNKVITTDKSSNNSLIALKQ